MLWFFAGETNLERIQSNVRRDIADKFPLYCLGFGYDVNFEFLEKMSLQNNGVARRIYEDSDADLQLKVFEFTCSHYKYSVYHVICYISIDKIDPDWLWRDKHSYSVHTVPYVNRVSMTRWPLLC